MTLQKSLRAQQIAFENRLPCISLVESAGANLLYQDEVFILGGQTSVSYTHLDVYKRQVWARGMCSS